ncbi:ABC transporter ATP-binding protein [Pseudorhodoferax soli]|uniref:Amino acid/amide ABC transporter ATP-binding protein 1 (HAAT family) n=1 Tax=Pseudorhodoferax soli TaxID=545864 RepID=A0A368XLB0_9BURK|nr:ABC transporter ATP-binding protein [Pseudorhodoferax soli]RCW68772.1 amino acid/amide ABC transporter ATP-binding protein 1 (HAAT family) [Pseudorhodoferax soli]
MSLFQVEGLVKRFGALLATDHVNLGVDAGEIHALIGPNGAGKSTLVNLISGLFAADAGRVLLDGQDLTRLPMHDRVRAGLSRCFQITSIFREATVRDNLLLAAQAHAGSSFGMLRDRRHERPLADTAQALAERVGLAAEQHRVAGTLPHGAQRKLDVALALAANPKLLLLDEPMAGMGPEDSERMTELIHTLKRDMAILLIEHDMKAVFALADRISVLVYGKVLVSGSVEAIRGNPQVQAVYLGTEDTTGAPA